jgi:Transposase domain (DUF772)
VNLAIRWFIGDGLHERLPDDSSLTRIRQRWGAERFRRIFERTVKACIEAGIAGGETVHVDASLIRANVSWESLAERHVETVGRANDDDEEVQRKGRQIGRTKKVCVTDPEATMATNARNRRLEPAYKQHAVVDDVRGLVLDVEVTTGEINEGQMGREYSTSSDPRWATGGNWKPAPANQLRPGAFQPPFPANTPLPLMTKPSLGVMI